MSFLSLRSSKKLKIGFVLLFLFFLFALPLTTHAGPEQEIANRIVSLLARLVLAVTGKFFELAVMILSWTTGPEFIKAPITNNAFVNPTWGLVRDMANMIFVIALIAIGVGTALRTAGYEAQKALPRLIFHAILINFTLVICGVFIDAASIVMNFFLGEGVNLDWWRDILVNQSSILDSSLDANVLGNVGRLTALAIFNTLGGLALLMFAIIFTVRYVVLWIYVILSPLAFAFNVIPATRGYWKQWLNGFTQWLLVGVTAAFWLYLGQQILFLSLSSPPPASAEFGTMEIVFSYTVPIVFFLTGFGAATATGVAGATAAVAVTTRALKGAGQRVAKSRTFQRATGAAANVSAKALAQANRLAGIPLIGAPLTWGTRKAEQSLLKYTARVRKYTPPSEFDNMTIDQQASYVRTLSSRSDQLVAVARMSDKGLLQKADAGTQKHAARLAEAFAEDPYFRKEVSSILDTLPDTLTKELKLKTVSKEKRKDMEEQIESTARTVMALMPDADMIKRAVEKTGKKEGDINAADKDRAAQDIAAQVLQIKGLKPSDLANLSKSALGSDAMRIAARSFSSPNIQKLYDTYDRATVEKIFDGAGGLRQTVKSPADLLALHRDNPQLVNWLHHNPAGKQLGIEAVSHIGPDGVWSNWDKFMEDAGVTTDKRQDRMDRLNEEVQKKQAVTQEHDDLAKQPKLSSEDKKRLEELESRLKEIQHAEGKLEAHQLLRQTEIRKSIGDVQLTAEARAHIEKIDKMTMEELKGFYNTGTVGERQSFYDLTGKNSTTILRIIIELRGTGNAKEKREADELERKYNYVMKNFKFLRSKSAT